jgi:hypothetical protein
MGAQVAAAVPPDGWGILGARDCRQLVRRRLECCRSACRWTAVLAGKCLDRRRMRRKRQAASPGEAVTPQGGLLKQQAACVGAAGNGGAAHHQQRAGELRRDGHGDRGAAGRRAQRPHGCLPSRQGRHHARLQREVRLLAPSRGHGLSVPVHAQPWSTLHTLLSRHCMLCWDLPPGSPLAGVQWSRSARGLGSSISITAQLEESRTCPAWWVTRTSERGRRSSVRSMQGWPAAWQGRCMLKIDMF